MNSHRNIHLILDALQERYPEAPLALEYTNPFELLVAVLLSARCTDERVNMVTRELFKHLATPEDFMSSDIHAVEDLIRPTGFYRNKAKLLQNCCRELQIRFRGEVPTALEDLIQLPGIGRKSANMIRGNAFGLPGIAVDTHVQRVVSRLELSLHKDPVKIEKVLCDIIPAVSYTHLRAHET